jgi:hypothetical protein
MRGERGRSRAGVFSFGAVGHREEVGFGQSHTGIRWHCQAVLYCVHEKR